MNWSPRRTRIVLAHGCFDLLHLGHIRHLEEAAALGDWLVVSVTADRFIRKAPSGRPHFTAEQRREALLALTAVNEVVISDSETAVDVIKAVRPAIYVKGIDYNGRSDPNLDAERRTVEALGGRFHITAAEKWSSTNLLRGIMFPEETLAYLDGARRRGFLDQIAEAFRRADRLKIAFLGETIIDEYRYVSPLAKPNKESVLATVDVSSESFDGGIVAAAKHGDWSNTVVVSTPPAALTKTRFVDAAFSRKLFEVYSAPRITLSPEERQALQDRMRAAAAWADVCLVIDFGHGMFGNIERDIVSRKSLAVTAQTNAANSGFNLITLYDRAAFICVDEPEARMAMRDQTGDITVILGALGTLAGARSGIVTMGHHGSISWSKDGGARKIPAFADKALDTMGAGDAFIAIAAPLVSAGLPVEMAAFAGNVAGGLKTAILGHRTHVGRDDIVKNIEWLLR